jgi:hypothetical protein
MLMNAMYGMKISGKYWYDEFRDWILSVGFVHSEMETS